MKVILLLVILVACSKKPEAEKECTRVREIGSCTQHNCAVQFSNGESYYYASQSLVGDMYCRLNDTPHWLPVRMVRR